MLVLAYEGIQLFICSTSIEHCMAAATTVQTNGNIIDNNRIENYVHTCVIGLQL